MARGQVASFFYYKSNFKVRALKFLPNVDLYNAHTLKKFGEKISNGKRDIVKNRFLILIWVTNIFVP